MAPISESATDFLADLSQESILPTAATLAAILDPERTALADILQSAGSLRRKYFQNQVRIHILNNVRNGHCKEDCGYCAQRKGRQVEIAAYADKTDAEILAEARQAWQSGAWRYCMATSGTGLNAKSTERFAKIIRQIKSEMPIQVCLSAGLVRDPSMAAVLQNAGLDRYNHNLNTAESHYDKICSTHEYQDRLQTLRTMQSAGVSLCSGIIAGLGESDAELVDMALTLRQMNVPSIPVNFFIPVEGHAIQNPGTLDAERCLRILALFRLTNPSAEIRMAAGRELYLGDRQPEALAISNSLFMSGYLNARGQSSDDTIGMILQAGYEIDVAGSERPDLLKKLLAELQSNKQGEQTSSNPSSGLTMKSRTELRPFENLDN
ncbi:MAG: biotin synthase BioB [Leptospiraceae bacterium]|nr:biotin synthase BioB [Leptospiraceae bacterium]